MNSANREKSLPDERYDEKLFKQAYKAGIEAKELEKKNIRKKNILKVIGILLSLLIFIGSILSIFFFKEKTSEYIEAIEGNRHKSLIKIEDNLVVSSLTEEISISEISAESVLVFNSKNGSILFEKNIDERRAVASITKLLSIMVALETFDIESSIDVNVDNIPEDLEWTLQLKQGDRIKVDYLLKAMLLSSYNDTAFIVANAYPGGYDSFIKAMNKKAKVLRMDDSSFDNPAGLDSEKNYSTARDIGRLVSAVLNYEYILNLVDKGAAQISWNSTGELKSETVYTTNKLYGVNKYIKGLKTGITKNAKQCFVGYFVYDETREIITVVLGSEDRFKDTEKLELLSRKVLK